MASDDEDVSGMERDDSSKSDDEQDIRGWTLAVLAELEGDGERY
jgi:hypothetical protein